MSFPRLAIHTGNMVVAENRHPRWEGTIVLQHNETTATMLKHGRNMSNGAKTRHPLLSTWQSNCRAAHWSDYNADIQFARENDVWDGLLFGQEVKNGQVESQAAPVGVNVAPAVAH